MSLKSQRRLASEMLKVGKSRVWIDPERIGDVEVAITREEVRRLIHEGAIRALPKVGVSRARARLLHEKRKRGRRRGAGSRSGADTARNPQKEDWMRRIRAIRKELRELRDRRIITKSVYRRLYLLAKGGVFEDSSHLRQYIEDHRLTRRR
ncbi:MAG: 50S ribosomal protein L19e [Candidatus Bathyarchaeia archaeon]